MVKRPSDDLALCGECHQEIAANYKKSLHYTTIGQRNRVVKRMSAEETKIFDEKVFEKSCRSCHATCGDCHVKSPSIGGVSVGLIDKHKFVRKNEGKTCAFCHGGRVYPEYTGEYGGNADIHYQKGMMCMDCHTMDEMHGDGKAYAQKEEVRDRPRCTDCHEPGRETKLTARVAHLKHSQTASCFACHSAGEYRQLLRLPSRGRLGGQTGLLPGDEPEKPQGDHHPAHHPHGARELQARGHPAGELRRPAELLGCADPQHPQAHGQDPQLRHLPRRQEGLPHHGDPPEEQLPDEPGADP